MTKSLQVNLPAMMGPVLWNPLGQHLVNKMKNYPIVTLWVTVILFPPAIPDEKTNLEKQILSTAQFLDI